MIPLENNRELLAPPDESERAFLNQAKHVLRDAAIHKIPSYDILEMIGQGGFASVYLARQISLSRLVALKVIPWNPLSSRHTRFQREAEILGKLSHPHIVAIHDSGSVGGWHYYASEYCPGGSLAERIKGQVLSPKHAATIVKCIAQTMAVVHSLKIVHRDLKPSNILVAEEKAISWDDLTLKIADFGLAHYSEDADFTASGDGLGTPQYMAPEQLQNAKIAGPLADVYSVGAILYQLLTGRPPHLAATFAESILQITRNDPVSPRQLVSQVPVDLETICLKCLEKNPSLRYQSMQSLADDLQRFLNREPIHARPISVTRKLYQGVKKHPVLSVSLLAFLLLLSFLIVSYSWLSIERAETASHRVVANQAKLGELLSAIRSRRVRMDAGWRANNEIDIQQAESLATSSKDAENLHNELIAVRHGYDFGLPREFRSKDGDVFSITFHPTRPLLALGYADAKENTSNIVDLLDTDSLTILERISFDTLPGPFGGNISKTQDGIRSLAFSPDGETLAIGTRSGQIVTVLMQTQPRRTSVFARLPDGATELFFIKNGTALLAISRFIHDHSNVFILDLKEKSVQPHEIEVKPSHQIAASGNGKYFLYKTDEKVMRYSTEPLRALCEYNILHSSIGQTYDGLQVMLAGGRSADEIKALAQHKTESDLRIHPPFLTYLMRLHHTEKPWAVRYFDIEQRQFNTSNPFPTLTFMQSNQVLVSKSIEDNTFFMLSLQSGRKVARLVLDREPTYLAVNRLGDELAICSGERILCCKPHWPCFEKLPITELPLFDAAISSDGKHLAYLTDEAAIAYGLSDDDKWNTEVQYARPGEVGTYSGLSPRLIMMSPKNGLLVWHRQYRSCMELQWSRPNQKINRYPVALSNYIVESANGEIWATSDGTILKLTDSPVPIIAFEAKDHPEKRGYHFLHLCMGRQFALAIESSGKIIVLNCESNNRLRLVSEFKTEDESRPSALALTNDEQYAVCGSTTGQLEVRKTANMTVTSRSRISHEKIASISCSKDNLIAVGSANGSDGILHLLRIKDDRLITISSLTLPNPIKKLKFVADGTKLFVLEDGSYAPKLFTVAELVR